MIGVNLSFKMMWSHYQLHADYKWNYPFANFSNYYKHELDCLQKNGVQLMAPLDHSLQPTTDLPHLSYYSDVNCKFTGDYANDGRILRLGHSSTSVFHAMQMAVIMGAEKILLLGVDFYVDVDSQGVGKMHTYSAETKIERQYAESLDRRLDKFDKDLRNKALPILNAKKVKVINCSKKSKLRVFPKIPLKEAL
jgi:hypothetical protein